MAEITMWHGNALQIDYTPTAGDIDAGTVVLLGNTTGPTCGVSFRDMPNNVLGALDAGGAVYSGVNLNNAAVYTKVYWDDSVNKFTSVSTNNALFGFIVDDGGGGANTTCRVFHWPYPAP